MVMRAWLVLAAILAFAARAPGAAEARLELPENMPPDVAVECHVTVVNGAQISALSLPEVEGLTLVQSGAYHNYMNNNGRTEETMSLSLRAAAVGEYRVPAITVRLRDHTSVSTAPVTVRAGPGNPNLTGSAYAVVDFLPDTIVPGEPTTMRYRLYLRGGAFANNVDVRPPEGLMEVGSEHGVVARGSAYDLRGEQWQLFTVTWQMTADQPGTFEAGGQQSVESRRGGFGGGGAKDIAVRPGKLTVLALPAEGRPADFAGLVGPVTLTQTLARERISAGEGTALVVTITGPLAARAHAPEPRLPHGLRAYAKEPETDDQRRVFTWDLVPEGPGTYAIPGASIPYFDPESREYRRAETPPLSLEVLPGRVRELAVSGAAPAATPEPARPAAPAAEPPPAPLRGEGGLQPPPAAAPLAFVVGLAVALLAALAPRGLRALRRPPHRGRQLAAALAAGRLDEAAMALARLRPELTDPALREAAAELDAAIDLARFGGGPLPRAARELARPLEERP
jgi:hypothetical protein